MLNHFPELVSAKVALKPGEVSIIAPTASGRGALLQFTTAVKSGGSIKHKIGDVISSSQFSNAEEIYKLFNLPIAHSEWFVSFENGARAYLDYEDEFAIILSQPEIVELSRPFIDLAGLYQSAHRLLGDLQDADANPDVIDRLSYLLSRAAK